MGTIQFSNNEVSPDIKDKLKLKLFLINIFKDERVDFKKVTYIFCKDDYLLRLNKKYLHHNTFTDIITFTLSDKFQSIISEIYISIDRVKENAANLKVEYEEELRRVMIHGILHLCGFSDHTPEKKREMRKMEDFYLSKYSST